MLAALGHLQTLLVPPRWGCISPKRTTHMGQMSLVLSEIPPFMQSLERVKKSPVRFLPPALLLQSLAPAFSSTPGDPPAPPPQNSPGCWAGLQQGLWKLLLPGPWSPLTRSGGEMQRQRDAAARASFLSPSPLQSCPRRVQHLWGGPFPPCGAGPCLHFPGAVSVHLPRGCRWPFSSVLAGFFPGFPLCRRLGMVRSSSLQRPLLRGCC